MGSVAATTKGDMPALVRGGSKCMLGGAQDTG
jgi:hypothetical protein